ncbi:hypothetical protein VCR15J2_20234 [Vibrio coralliirubri]|nr:hypothetical protein VCR15J2_20234 [Vibrio coralliirubri]
MVAIDISHIGEADDRGISAESTLDNHTLIFRVFEYQFGRENREQEKDKVSDDAKRN